MEEERIPQRKKKKRRNYGNRLAFVIAGAVIFAYVFFEIFSAYFGGLETEPAVQVSVNDSFTQSVGFSAMKRPSRDGRGTGQTYRLQRGARPEGRAARNHLCG